MQSGQRVDAPETTELTQLATSGQLGAGDGRERLEE